MTTACSVRQRWKKRRLFVLVMPLLCALHATRAFLPVPHRLIRTPKPTHRPPSRVHMSAATTTNTAPATKKESHMTKFDLPTTIMLAPFAFEVYNDPPPNSEGRLWWQRIGQHNHIAVLNEKFLTELYAGLFKIRVHGISGKTRGKKDSKTLKLLQNCQVIADLEDSTTRWAPLSMNGTAVDVNMDSGIFSLSSSYEAKAVDVYLPRRSLPKQPQQKPPTMINLNFGDEKQNHLGNATLFIHRFFKGPINQSAPNAFTWRGEVPLYMKDPSGAVFNCDIEIEYISFPSMKYASHLWNRISSRIESQIMKKRGMVEEAQARIERWSGPTGCSRDWRKLATAVGGKALLTADMQALCFVENDDSDTQLKVWRDEKAKKLVVSFRGTEFWKWKDLVTDLKLLQEPWNITSMVESSSGPQKLDKKAKAARKEKEKDLKVYTSLVTQASYLGHVYNNMDKAMQAVHAKVDSISKKTKGPAAQVQAPKQLEIVVPPTNGRSDILTETMYDTSGAVMAALKPVLFKNDAGPLGLGDGVSSLLQIQNMSMIPNITRLYESKSSWNAKADPSILVKDVFTSVLDSVLSSSVENNKAFRSTFLYMLDVMVGAMGNQTFMPASSSYYSYLPDTNQMFEAMMLGYGGINLTMMRSRFKDTFGSLVNETFRAMGTDTLAADNYSYRWTSPNPANSRDKILSALDGVLENIPETSNYSPSFTAGLKIDDKAFGMTTEPRVHSGFREAYLSVRKDLFDVMDVAAGGKLVEDNWHVYCTGHSLGGALAILLCHELSVRLGGDKVTMYNFGAPRTGNSAFVEAYSSVNQDSYRIVNTWDPIARFPRGRNASFLNYEHVGKTVLLNSKDPGDTWIEGVDSGLCPLRDLQPLRHSNSSGSFQLEPLFLEAEWQLLNAFFTGTAYKQHLESQYFNALGGLEEKTSGQTQTNAGAQFVLSAAWPSPLDEKEEIRASTC